MLRSLRKITAKNSFFSVYIQKSSFLTNDYKCNEAWNSQLSTPLLDKININDFYNRMEQNYSSKGVISAIDVDIFANALKDSVYLEELGDLLHKLRLSAETGSTLDSTHHATVRNYIKFDYVSELVEILKQPLNFGLFLDQYTANILLDKLITSNNYELAASVASLIMLQEDFTNEISCALCQYACYKYILGYTPSSPEHDQPIKKNKKVEEIKIRIKFLRNPYCDDHFDIKDTYTLSGKTLAWISERFTDNLNRNLQVVGWLIYKKYDKLLSVCEIFKKGSLKLYGEVLDLLKKECDIAEGDDKAILENCIAMLSQVNFTQTSLEESLKITIENAINKTQAQDISQQHQLFKLWTKIREEKLEEQTKRLDRAKRMEVILEKQERSKEEEQKLWFFENEESIDLEIEEKEKLVNTPQQKKDASKKSDENYIPPEILPKRR